MTQAELDPQFYDYLSDNPSLTYVQPTDKYLRRLVINRLEIALGRRKIEAVYHSLKEAEFDIGTFFTRAIEAGDLEINYRGLHADQIDVDGPLVFLANHPFGILDGVVLCDLAARLRGDLRILINAVLCQDKDLAPYFLPVDFDEGRRAIKTNIRTKQLALKSLAEDVPVLIFPSGMVSTADRFGFGQVADAPWTTFAAKLIRESRATVVPVHFHGQNSRKFHVASHIAEPLRMGMLMHEALNKFGDRMDVTIGDPLGWEQLEQYPDRQSLTQALYSVVQGLARQES